MITYTFRCPSMEVYQIIVDEFRDYRDDMCGELNPIFNDEHNITRRSVIDPKNVAIKICDVERVYGISYDPMTDLCLNIKFTICNTSSGDYLTECIQDDMVYGIEPRIVDNRLITFDVYVPIMTSFGIYVRR